MLRRHLVAHLVFSLACAFLVTATISLFPTSAAEAEVDPCGNASTTVPARSAVVVNRPDQFDQFGDPLPKGAVARLGTIRHRHGGIARDVAFSPDGMILATCGGDSAIRLWDLQSGRPLRTLFGRQRDSTDTYCIAFSPDGTKLVAGSGGAVRLWDLPTGQCLMDVHDHIGLVASVAFAPDGKTFATAANNRLLVWDVTTGKLLQEWVNDDTGFHQADFNLVAYSPDGTRLVAEDGNGIHVWELPGFGGPRTIPNEGFENWSLAFAGNSGHLITAANRDDRTTDETGKGVLPHYTSAIRIRDIATGKLVREDSFGKDLPKDSPVVRLAVSPDGKTLVTAHQQELLVWDFRSAKVLRRIPLEIFGSVRKLAISPDNKSLAAVTVHTPASSDRGRRWAKRRSTAFVTKENTLRSC